VETGHDYQWVSADFNLGSAALGLWSLRITTAAMANQEFAIIALRLMYLPASNNSINPQPVTISTLQAMLRF